MNRPLFHDYFYTSYSTAREAMRLTWWATELKRTWYTIDNKRTYGWELI
jgi:hypothetical protein